MTVRERMEQLEYESLAPNAAKAAESKGRALFEEESDVRTCFQRDNDRILHSKAFRRLTHKTQAFLRPEGDHYRTRMTHTLEVSRIGRTIARALQLNEDLTEAIAFGHAGEAALCQITGQPFSHNEQSLRVVDKLERNGQGLNLTYEVRRGILCHTGSDMPETLEGQIIRYADRIAYLNHDIDDVMRAGILTESDIPRDVSVVLGDSHRDRINTLVEDMIFQGLETGTIAMHPEIEAAMQRLREFMFEKVYRNPVVKGEESKVGDILKHLYEYYCKNPEKLPADFLPQLDFDGFDRTVCDYIAGMTDKYAVHMYQEIFIPSAWQMR